MRLIKIVPVVGLCVASFLPATVTAEAAKYGHITNQGSEMCLDATNKRDNAIVQQSTCDSSKDGQMWQAKSDGTYVNKWTGKCLDVYSTEKQDSDLNTVTTSECRNLQNQKWDDNCSKANAVIKNNCGARIHNTGTGQCLAAPLKLEFGPVKVVDCSDNDFLNWKK